MTTKRPERKNADATRKKILKTATELFLTHGFAGTSMGKLAELANVNQSLIFHHFTDKANLWSQVKIHLLEGIEIPNVNPKPENLKIFLKEALQQRIETYAKRPELLRLVGWQRLEATSAKAISLSNPLIAPDWLAPIKYLQSKNLINPKLNPQLIFVWILYSTNGLIIDDFRDFKNNPENKNAYIEMITKGLCLALEVSL